MNPPKLDWELVSLKWHFLRIVDIFLCTFGLFKYQQSSFYNKPTGIRSKPLTTFDLVYPSVLEHNEQIRNLRSFASLCIIGLQLKENTNNATSLTFVTQREI